MSKYQCLDLNIIRFIIFSLTIALAGMKKYQLRSLGENVFRKSGTGLQHYPLGKNTSHKVLHKDNMTRYSSLTIICREVSTSNIHFSFQNRLADIRRQIFEAHCWGTGGDQELAMQRIKSIQQPAFPQGQHDEVRYPYNNL